MAGVYRHGAIVLDRVNLQIDPGICPVVANVEKKSTLNNEYESKGSFDPDGVGGSFLHG